MLVSQSKKLYQFLFKNVRVFRFKESYVFSIYSWIAPDYTAKYNLVVKKINRYSIALKFSVFEHKRWITKAKNSNNFHEKVWEFFALRRGSNVWILAFQTKRVFQHFPLVSVIQHFVSFCESWCTTLFGWHAQPQCARIAVGICNFNVILFPDFRIILFCILLICLFNYSQYTQEVLKVL